MVVFIAAVLIALVEKPWTFQALFDSFNWGIATVLGQGDSAFVTSAAGRVVGWLRAPLQMGDARSLARAEAAEAAAAG